MAHCANCLRTLTETQSSLNCLCRPQFDALHDEVDRLWARESAVRALCAAAPTISDPWAYDWKGDRVVRVDDVMAVLNAEESQ